MFARTSLICLSAAALAACAVPGATPQALAAQASDAPVETGPLRVTLLGDYVGKPLRISVDGRVLVSERLTFPPMGAEHRYDIAWGAAQTVVVQVDIEGCDRPWAGPLQLVPGRSAHLLFRGCDVEALAPD